MSEKQAKKRRQEMRAAGIDPNPAPTYNADPEAIDTRKDRRDKKFRKKKLAAETKAMFGEKTPRERTIRLTKTWGRLLNARAIKATNAALREAEEEQVAS